MLANQSVSFRGAPVLECNPLNFDLVVEDSRRDFRAYSLCCLFFLWISLHSISIYPATFDFYGSQVK